jgi:hypothetical protein
MAIISRLSESRARWIVRGVGALIAVCVILVLALMRTSSSRSSARP